MQGVVFFGISIALYAMDHGWAALAMMFLAGMRFAVIERIPYEEIA